jgi:putative acetyltransferase
MKNKSFNIRHGQPDDISELQKLFVSSITTVCTADYNTEQITVWTAGVNNNAYWIDLTTKQFLLIVHNNESILGFGSLKDFNHFDMLYVHPNHQGEGIASALYLAIETEAKQQNQTLLTADVSKTALPFFEKMGFTVINPQTIIRQGVELTNFKMKKVLS